MKTYAAFGLFNACMTRSSRSALHVMLANSVVPVSDVTSKYRCNDEHPVRVVGLLSRNEKISDQTYGGAIVWTTRKCT